MSEAKAREPAPENPVATSPAPESEHPTWEDDETIATAVLRAVFILVAGGLLAWAQWNAPILPAQQWGRWVGTSVVFNLLIPLGLVCFFLAQTITHQDWLKDQKSNAWNYGWSFKAWRHHLKLAAVAWVCMLPFLVYFSAQADVRANYASYLPPVVGFGSLLFLLSTTVLYMFCWEWFFRGFLLFGMAQGVGAGVATVLQAIIFALAHSGKPPVEMGSSLLGGLVLGAVCWREKSFAPAFYAHALIHLTWTILMVR